MNKFRYSGKRPDPDPKAKEGSLVEFEGTVSTKSSRKSKIIKLVMADVDFPLQECKHLRLTKIG